VFTSLDTYTTGNWVTPKIHAPTPLHEISHCILGHGLWRAATRDKGLIMKGCWVCGRVISRGSSDLRQRQYERQPGSACSLICCGFVGEGWMGAWASEAGPVTSGFGMKPGGHLTPHRTDLRHTHHYCACALSWAARFLYCRSHLL